MATLGLMGLTVAGVGIPLASAADPMPAPAIDLRVQQWHGPAICYSGYRAGQMPKTETFPSQPQVLEDLKILERHWRVIRVYGSDRHSEDVLEVIRRERLNLKVMLGIWLNGQPGFEAESARQLATGIRLAQTYPDVVVAVNVGNEALVFWSDHKATEDQMLAWVREVRAAVRCPITVADDILYWREPKARLVEAVDFITLHSYPIWGGSEIDKGLSGTVGHFESVHKAHPGKTIVLGELGWATYTVGEKHAPRAGDETKQKRYFEEISAWAQANGVTAFFFEAFDEPWKGAGTEGHWGLFSLERRAKLALRGLFPDLLPSGPTSPSYDALTPAGGPAR